MYKEGREERRVGGMGEKKGREEGETGRGGGGDGGKNEWHVLCKLHAHTHSLCFSTWKASVK